MDHHIAQLLSNKALNDFSDISLVWINGPRERFQLNPFMVLEQ